MARGTDARMIPDLASFRPDWLDSAEISFALDGLGITGLSFFFHDAASCLEFAAAESLDQCVMDDEKWLRGEFSILPRHWLKIHYVDMVRCGLSQYFFINPTTRYPITTIRCFLRRYGYTNGGKIEGLLNPALEARDTQWGLVLKRNAEQIIPRIFFSVPRALLSEVLTPFVRFGYLSAPDAEQYREWNNQISAGDRIFVSLDPTLGRLSSVDFCTVVAAQFFEKTEVEDSEPFDYLKVRIMKPDQAAVLIGYLQLPCFPSWVTRFGGQQHNQNAAEDLREYSFKIQSKIKTNRAATLGRVRFPDY